MSAPGGLSDRATAWLGSLERRVPVSVERVRRALAEAGAPAPVPWLEFHERYAGYVVPLGLDGAVWGLAFERGTFWPSRVPFSVDVERDDPHAPWTIGCADVHPSYDDYRLDERGRFLDGPSSSFDVHVEQKALWVEFCRGSTSARVRPGADEDALARIDADAVRVDEASDVHLEYWRGSTVLAVRDADASRWLTVVTL